MRISALQKISSREGAETLVMNDRYFFSLLEGMIRGDLILEQIECRHSKDSVAGV